MPRPYLPPRYYIHTIGERWIVTFSDVTDGKAGELIGVYGRLTDAFSAALDDRRDRKVPLAPITVVGRA